MCRNTNYGGKIHTDNAGSSVRVPRKAHGVGVIRGNDEQSVLHQALLGQNLHGLFHSKVQGNGLGESLLRLREEKNFCYKTMFFLKKNIGFIPMCRGERGRYAHPQPSRKIRLRLLSKSGEARRFF